MILSYFLSRQKHDESDPHKITPISFNIQEVLHPGYYNMHENEQKRYLIQTRSQTKSSGTVNGIDKGVYPNPQAVKPMIRTVVTPVQSHVSTELKGQYHVKPRLVQSSTGIKKNMLSQSDK